MVKQDRANAIVKAATTTEGTDLTRLALDSRMMQDRLSMPSVVHSYLDSSTHGEKMTLVLKTNSGNFVFSVLFYFSLDTHHSHFLEGNQVNCRSLLT